MNMSKHTTEYPTISKQISIFIVFTMVLFGVLRGLRFPNASSYTLYLFNYDYGFIKRGLLGELAQLSQVDVLLSYPFFFLFVSTIAFINLLLIASFIKDIIKTNKFILVVLMCLYASSMSLIYLSHTIGYADHIGLLITLITLKISGFYKKLVFLFISFTLALFIHEGILVLFFPIVFMALVLSFEKEQIFKQGIWLGVFSVSMMALTSLIGKGLIPLDMAQMMYSDLNTLNNINLNQPSFEIMTHSAQENFNIMASLWSSYLDTWTLKLLNSFIVTLPTALILTFFIYKMLSKQSVHWVIILLACSAAFSPLLLHLFAYDAHRWNSLVITNSFLLFCLVWKLSPASIKLNVTIGNNMLALIMLLIFVNGASHIDLFAETPIQDFPFKQHQNYLINLLRGDNTFPDINPD